MPRATPPIAGSDLVTNWFGYWPNFHDAQIIELRLGAEPVLRLRAFEATNHVDAAGYYKLQKHCTVSFRFEGEIEFSLSSDSGAAGIVGDLQFAQAETGLKMTIQSSCGIDGWLVARNWRVELEPAAEG